MFKINNGSNVFGIHTCMQVLMLNLNARISAQSLCEVCHSRHLCSFLCTFNALIRRKMDVEKCKHRDPLHRPDAHRYRPRAAWATAVLPCPPTVLLLLATDPHFWTATLFCALFAILHFSLPSWPLRAQYGLVFPHS